MSELETLAKLIASWMRDDRNGHLFQTWLTPTRSQRVDILMRDHLANFLAEFRRSA